MSKQWGRGEYWGVGSDFDPDWFLTEKEKELRQKLIQICKTTIRPHAIHCDRTYEFPRKSLNALAELGLLGLLVPMELGGLGESHTCASMVVETIARYGCPSTAMIYTMHLVSCVVLLFRYHNNDCIKDLLSRLDKDKLVGTLSISDPATGGHFWFSLSSRTKWLDKEKERIQLLKYGSWVTSAGFADWYVIQTISPNSTGDYSILSHFLVFKDEVRSSTDDWSAIGMHGNQSGSIVVEGTFTSDRLIGLEGDAVKNNENGSIFFLLFSSSSWNGIAMGCIDIAKKHVTRKAHADVGMRVCDYPSIQNYFGECLTDTNVSRIAIFSVAKVLDEATNNCDWSLHSDLSFLPRADFIHWGWQMKFTASKNVSTVCDTMLHACGGSGYKTDLGIERLLRDGKAGWVMALSNEVIRQFLGIACLQGLEAIDCWELRCNERKLYHELGKMSLKDKKALAEKILREVKTEEEGESLNHPFQETDFENPFNTAPPTYLSQNLRTADGVDHGPCLSPTTWTPLVLESKYDISEKMGSFTFNLSTPTDHTGCLPGQYVKVRVTINGKNQERYFSPVSKPDDFGKIELVLRFETQGLISQYFKGLNPGDKVDFQGPCGGFEYEASKVEHLTLLASGGGITPGMQLIRCIIDNPKDTTHVTLLYFSENVDEILYRKELDDYAAKNKLLKVIYTLGESPEDWEGEEGFIDTTMIKEYVTKPNGHRYKIVMCGGPAMTISCLYSLSSLDFPSDCVYIYGQFGTEQVKAVFGKKVKLSGHYCDNAM
ncbi:uncharacterized protein LOC143039424 [Oratosquilla oratoria]|uniref:uncharacterized protein LOC143039424 n=1 Tax=Oratosquilla oratoria TaxID=337810 RepID=UPI003F774947